MRPVVPSRVSQKFANPRLYASRADVHGQAGHHTGVDYGSAWPIPIHHRTVRSALPGEVVISEYNATMGNWVGVYTHDLDLLVTYWHLHQRRVALGTWVQVFEPLGTVGDSGNSTAPHLHVQVNRGREFNYHGHLPPRVALGVYSRREARTLYRKNPVHPRG